MGKLSPQGAKRLLALTALAVVSYALGALSHSEIMHFLGDLFGLE